MIDIIDFDYQGKEKFGFFRFYHFNDFKIIIGDDDNKNRKAVENKNVDILLSPEKIRKNDFMHSRDSGLNQILCKLAKKNNVAVGFNFRDVLKSKERWLLLGKMMQNVMLCRKYKVQMIVISGAKDESELKNAMDLFSFAQVIGMTPGEAKKSLNFEKRKD